MNKYIRQDQLVLKTTGQFKGRRRIPVTVQGLPRCSAGVGPLRSQWVEPASAGEGVALPSRGWAAPSGEQEVDRRRSTDGGEPVWPSSAVWMDTPGTYRAGRWPEGTCQGRFPPMGLLDSP